MGKKRFFPELIPPLAVFAISVSAYFFFSCPGLFWEDSPQMDIVARTLSITHSPGHPLYSIMGRISVIIFGSFASQSRSVVLASVLYSSLSLFVYSFLLVRSGRSFLSSLGAPLIFGFSMPVFHYSTIAETYCLFTTGLCFFPLVFGSRKQFALYSYILGLFSGASILIAIIFPVAAVFFFFKDKNVRFLFLNIFLFSMGFSIYFFLFFRSQAGPPLDWGNPENIKNFYDMLTMKEFRGDFFSGFLAQKNLLATVANVSKNLILNSAFAGILLLAAGFISIFKKNGACALAIPVLFLAFLVFALNAGRGPDFEAYLIPLYFFASYMASHSDDIFKFRRLAGFFLVVTAIFNFFINHPPLERRSSFGAHSYMNYMLEKIPENSVVYCENTNEYFLLLNAQIAQGERSDLTLIFSDLLDEKWYLESLGEISGHLCDAGALMNYCLEKSLPLVYFPSSKTKSLSSVFTPKSCYFLFNGDDKSPETACRIIYDPEPASQNHQRVIWENQMNFFFSTQDIPRLLPLLDSLNANYSFWQYRLNRAKIRMIRLGANITREEAEEISVDLEKALALGADKDDIYYHRARLYILTGELEKAAQTVRLMRDSPDKSEASINLLLATGDVQGAKRELMKASLKWPEDQRFQELKRILGP